MQINTNLILIYNEDTNNENYIMKRCNRMVFIFNAHFQVPVSETDKTDYK